METSDKFISLNEQEYIIGQQIEVWYGDILSKVGEADKTFIYAKNERSGQMGTVHNSLLYPVIDRNENDALPYFHPYLLPKALDALKSGGKGTFLIKSSSTEETGYFVLLLNIGNCQIQQFLIKAEPYGYVLCGRRFPSIGHIIDNYCNLGLYRGVSLSRGVLYSGRYLPLSHSSSCYSFSSSDMKTIALDYQNVASIEILWKYIRSHIWKKGRLLVWKLHSDTETLFEIKAVKNFVFKSSKSRIYPVDDAIFGRYTSAFVKNCDTGIFLNFKTIFDFVYCICTFRFSSPLARTALHVSLLSLQVNKFRSNDLKTNLLYSAHCCVDDVQLWSSHPIPPMITGRKTKGKVVFDESVLIPFMPEFQTIELSVLSHSNYAKEGQVFRAFTLNESYETIEDRNEMLDYHLQVHRVPVLESCCYESFNNWLLNCPLEYLFEISDMMTSHEKNFFCVCVISHFLFRRKMLYQMLRRLMTYSLETSALDSILRQDSLTTTFLSQLLQILCRTEFIELIQEQLSDSCNEAFDDEAHITLIIKALNDLVSQNDVLRNILVVICQTAQEIFADSLLLSRKIISVILVLRFACPLLLKDKSFPPSVIKQVQMIANKSLSASETDSETVLTFRDLFDGISKFKFKEECSELYTFPWHGSAALACFLLFTTLSRNPEIWATLPASLRTILKLHKPH